MAAHGWQVRKEAVRSRGGVVAAQHVRAAEVGAGVLRAGGNAVDAAVATSLALGVLEPWMSGLGGGGCMLVRPADGEPVAVDCGMVAPRRLDPADYPLAGGGVAGDLFGWPAVVGDRNLHGPLAVAVPGLADGLRLAHERFGTVPFRELAAPAVALAEEGLAVDWYATLMVAGAAAELRRYPDAAAYWLPAGLPPVAPWTGETVRLPTPALAATLRRLAEEGLRGFYEGDTAAAVLADCARLGVPLDAADLAGYRARATAPLDLSYRSGRVLAMPGPFAGTALARCLELLAGEDLGPAPGERSFAAYARALVAAYRERLADDGPAPACTSHLSVADRHGNLVALTQTLLSTFGSKLLGPQTGLLLNNGVMWFDPRPGRPNSPAPGRQPLSNMCPAIGLGPDRRFALGASGGRRILPAVLQVASFLVDHGMGLEAALHQPRLDVSGTDLVTADDHLPFEVAPPPGAALRRLAPRPSPLLFACPVAVLDDLAGGWREGASEPMHPWAAAAAG